MNNYMNVLVFSEEYVKDNSNIPDNIDSQVLKMHMFESQNIDLRYFLGNDLFDVIIADFITYKTYVDGGGTDPITDKIDARILNLVDTCKPYLMYRTLYNGAYSFAVKFTNKGTTEQNSDYSDNVDITTVEKIRRQNKVKSDGYSNLILKYLTENSSTYPEFNTGENCESTNKRALSSVLYLGDNI